MYEDELTKCVARQRVKALPFLSEREASSFCDRVNNDKNYGQDMWLRFYTDVVGSSPLFFSEPYYMKGLDKKFARWFVLGEDLSRAEVALLSPLVFGNSGKLKDTRLSWAEECLSGFIRKYMVGLGVWFQEDYDAAIHCASLFTCKVGLWKP
jgi:hypothetical protein